MYEHITREYIKNHKFKHDGLYFEREKEQADFRFAPGTILPKSPEQKMIELRMKVYDIVHRRYEGNYVKIYTQCGIHRDVLIKFIANKKDGNRGFSRGALAKLCVGTGMDLKEASELFVLQGFALDPENNLLDAIVVNCIECNEDICTFFDMCDENNIQIDKKSAYI